MLKPRFYRLLALGGAPSQARRQARRSSAARRTPAPPRAWPFVTARAPTSSISRMTSRPAASLPSTSRAQRAVQVTTVLYPLQKLAALDRRFESGSTQEVIVDRRRARRVAAGAWSPRRTWPSLSSDESSLPMMVPFPAPDGPEITKTEAMASRRSTRGARAAGARRDRRRSCSGSRDTAP